MSLNILITAASRRVPLVLAFRNGLAALGIPGDVIAIDVNPMSPAAHFCDRAYRVPLSSDPGYLDAIANICDAERIGLIVPTIDDELPLFAGAAAASGSPYRRNARRRCAMTSTRRATSCGRPVWLLPRPSCQVNCRRVRSSRPS